MKKLGERFGFPQTSRANRVQWHSFHNKGTRGEVGGWGRDPKKCTGRDWGMGSSTINEPYAPSLSTIYDGA